MPRFFQPSAATLSGPRWAAWLGYGLGFIALASLFWAVWQGQQTMRMPLSGVSETAAPHVTSLLDASAIARQGWFGLEDAGNSAAVSGLAGVELKGISQTANPQLAGVYLAIKDAGDAFYRVGEVLPGGMGRLERLFADHVTILQNGVSAPLYFPGGGPGAAVAEGAGSNTGLADGAPVSGQPSPFFTLPIDQPAARPSAAQLAKQFVTAPEKLLAQAGLASAVSGQREGYVFNGQDPSGVFADAPVQKGDIILQVDGSTVGDPGRDRLLLADLIHKKALDLQIRRGGQLVTVHYTLP